ncbi:MAG: polyphosphate kinase 1 [Clostridia bacterium]|nr:polyphosphate kinase 1 [Clostridia bacterium]
MNYYINRELSWLKFNKRVLEQADAKEVPAFEQLRFISIFISNLDEFFMVRAGSLYDRSLLKEEMPDNKTGMTAKEQLDRIYEEARPLYALKDAMYKKVSDVLDGYGLIHTEFDELSSAQKKHLKQYFKREILPLLSPQIIDTMHPFPHLENKRLYVVAALKYDDKSSYGIIPISNVLHRVIFVPGEDGTFTGTYLLVEELIQKYAGEIFKQHKIVTRTVIRVTRNADVTVEDNFSDDDIDYRDYVKVIIKRREKLTPVRFEVAAKNKNKSGKLVKYMLGKLGLSEDQCFYTQAPADMNYIGELENFISNNTHIDKSIFFSSLPQRATSQLEGVKSITELASREDIFLSYPYDSIKHYLRLLEEAVDDENTVSIKITLYRLSSNSEIIRLLCRAADLGKEVTAVVELKARFDEANNINWSRRLEEAGCRVIYGIDSLKVHSKITLITRRIDDKISLITHIATGNYNEKTARLYTDVGIITSEETICSDAVEFFQNMTLGITQKRYKSLLVAPDSLKSGIIDEIRAEIESGNDPDYEPYICMKMNSLTDKEVIDELVHASQCGVKIDLIIRGICCLQPGIPDVTDNIRVISIVGRYLEHSRIFIFGKDDNKRVYIGSADLMTRNTSRRIEIITPIFDKRIANRLYEMTRVMLQDNVKSNLLCSNGEYEHLLRDSKPLDSQIYFFKHEV